MRDEILKYQKRLKMSGTLMDIYDSIEAESHEEYLLKLLRELYKDREDKRVIRNLNIAGFPLIKNLDNYDFSEITFPESQRLDTLLSLSFLDRKENLILYGSVGTGKTHLAIGLAVKAIYEKKKVVFYRLHDLISLFEASDDKKLLRLYKRIDQADLLILDEWGYLPLHQEGARLIFDIISRCYETKSIIITTNIEFSKWKGFLFDEKLTAAIVDRLVHHSHMLFFTGKSYRMIHSLMK